ncbi:hypothetical protein [Streptosporangium saharense]|uniref:Uncharacterized protein n=1 Tax=Streptosporangium saharense TaxID=1706840 RepID=A0A7W7QWT8_9ACTN|nr:hypothetical protein [Streptosporangium saharense]MBB4920993.1 hypothetical protein [Streptosporangium saharense]
MDVWELIAAAGVVGAMVIGVPLLLRGGGGRRRVATPAGRPMRVGPGAGFLVGAALLRRAPTVVLVTATVAVVALLVVNGRA